MKAKDFFEKQIPNIRELWNLSDAQKKMMYILMEEYAALCQTPVVGQSEQFYCTCSRAKGLDHDEEGTPYCISCQKEVQ